ncbi:MAG: triose-phosphate isomerase [Deltaproteobacteria bacterium]|nr:MAG: triose-phosphate isomerase [Deltaproteobacteria bacterium]
MARRPFVCGNWKMNTLSREAGNLAADVARLTGRLREVDVGIAPPFVHLQAVSRRVEDARVLVGAQNCHFEQRGAFTGEVSAPMLKDVGCKFVILGHSERRKYFGEDDALVNRKAHAALAAGLDLIVCVGERLEEREAGRTLEVVERQLRGSLEGFGAAELERTTVAYEPVWAIGTGRTATPQQAQEVHAAIRQVLAELGGEAAASVLRIQYGGSVKPENAADLLAQPDVDGALVGGASLDAEAFAAIVRAAASVRDV